jgi:hypothetical protein
MTQIRAQHPDIESALDANLESNSVEPQGSKTPSWFTRLPADTLQGDEKTPISHPYVQTPNIEAYEAYRKRMEQRVHEIPKSVERPTAGSYFCTNDWPHTTSTDPAIVGNSRTQKTVPVGRAEPQSSAQQPAEFCVFLG